MGNFGNWLMIIIGINIILALFGIVTPEGNLIATMLSDDVSVNTIWDVFVDNLNPAKTPAGLLTALGTIGIAIYGLVSKRDDLIYAPLIIFLLSVLGVFNFVSDHFIGDMKILGTLLKTGIIFLFTWSAIEWLRGVER